MLCQKTVVNVNFKRVVRDVMEDLDASTGKNSKKSETGIGKERERVGSKTALYFVAIYFDFAKSRQFMYKLDR